MRALRAAFCAAFFLIPLTQEAAAQDITLTSPDGTVEISGTLLGFDGEFYRVQTVYGELTVDGSGVLCDGPACPNLSRYVAEIAISGSATMGEVLVPALIEAFALRQGLDLKREAQDATHFEITLSDPEDGEAVGRFFFRLTTTAEGFADLLANEADIVMAAREIRPEELRRAEDAGLGDLSGRGRSHVVALDAVVPVVSPQNPVRRIALDTLADVVAGRIDNWSALGGPDAPITLYLAEEGSGLAQSAEDRLLRPRGLTPGGDITTAGPGSALAEAVARDPFGLGLASFAEVGPARALVLAGRCGFSLAASRRSIKTEDYPLTVPLFLYLPARRLPKLGRDFLAFALDPSAQIVVRRAGFVDQAPEEVPLSVQGDRLANAIVAAGPETGLGRLQEMVAQLRPKARLTLSFRFEAGSTRLDAQSRSNVKMLARDLSAGVYDGRRLTFAGFSDGQGPAAENLRIASRRAEEVIAAIGEALGPGGTHRAELELAAFGEALPLACDDSAWGRQVNRRVEVWID